MTNADEMKKKVWVGWVLKEAFEQLGAKQICDVAYENAYNHHEKLQKRIQITVEEL